MQIQREIKWFHPPVATGMEELRRWSPLLICIVPKPRLVHTPNRVAITLQGKVVTKC